MTFDVTILGCGAATPTGKHNPSAQVVNVHDKLFLIDCGEGTQMQLRKYKVKMQRINHIFISHLHGDHYLGLIGLMSSMHLLGRKSTLHIFGPEHLKELIDLNMKYSETYLEYTYEFHVTHREGRALIYEDRTMEVYSFPLKHRIDCTGFEFREKERSLKVKPEALSEFKLKPSQIIAVKKGKTIEADNGKTVTPEQACFPKDRVRSYAYCSDTMYWETLQQYVHAPTLLYHESTFLEKEKERAKVTFHSTAAQAARMAKLLNAHILLLGHYSSRYSEMDQFITEAKPHFDRVQLADEGMVVKVTYEEED